MKYTIGCDPGLSGAICFYRPDEAPIIFDMPCHQLTINGKKKRRVDVFELARVIDLHAKDCEHAFVEEVTASPQMGVTSSFSFGMASGLLQGVLAANFIPMTLVRPQVWKKHYGLNSDKDASRRKASSLLPLHNGMWSRAMDDGRAESLLIALWGSKQ